MGKRKNCTVEPNQQNRNIQHYNLYGVGLGGKKKQTWGTRIYLFTVPYKNSLPSKPMQVYL